MPALLCGPGNRPVKAELQFRAERYIHKASVIKPEEEMRLNCRAEGKAQTSSRLAAPTAPWSSRSNRGKGRGVVMGWGLCRRW